MFKCAAHALLWKYSANLVPFWQDSIFPGPSCRTHGSLGTSWGGVVALPCRTMQSAAQWTLHARARFSQEQYGEVPRRQKKPACHRFCRLELLAKKLGVLSILSKNESSHAVLHHVTGLPQQVSSKQEQDRCHPAKTDNVSPGAINAILLILPVTNEKQDATSSE